MSDKNETIVLSRDTVALLVPSGSSITLPRGTEVTITQALGNSFSVNVYGNLARIEGKDADALGLGTHEILDDLPKDASVTDKVWAQLRTVYDPELPVNIVDFGLIYDCDIERRQNASCQVKIDMTLTAPGCGMGPAIVADVKRKVLLIPEVDEVCVELVFDPPWEQEMMSEAAKLELGML